VIPSGIIARTSLLIRVSDQDTARLREDVASEHRSLSGYLLHLLASSIRVEQDYQWSIYIPFGETCPEIHRAAIQEAPYRSPLALHCRGRLKASANTQLDGNRASAILSCFHCDVSGTPGSSFISDLNQSCRFKVGPVAMMSINTINSKDQQPRKQ
jgi:hypothetical protein